MKLLGRTLIIMLIGVGASTIPWGITGIFLGFPAVVIASLVTALVFNKELSQ